MRVPSWHGDHRAAAHRALVPGGWVHEILCSDGAPTTLARELVEIVRGHWQTGRQLRNWNGAGRLPCTTV